MTIHNYLISLYYFELLWLIIKGKVQRIIIILNLFKKIAPPEPAIIL